MPEINGFKRFAIDKKFNLWYTVLFENENRTSLFYKTQSNEIDKRLANGTVYITYMVVWSVPICQHVAGT